MLYLQLPDSLQVLSPRLSTGNLVSVDINDPGFGE
jgi:hypothetical protein